MPGDGPPACPFIAFEDERDERSSSPDHRHRCFAEVTPAPRALAHQEAYCLSSAFPVCPTFQDWARREAAQARAAGRSTPGTAGVAVGVVGAAATGRDADDPGPGDDDPEPEDKPVPARGPEDDDEDPWSSQLPSNEPPARRNPPRDWAAPPPWAGGAAAGSAAAGSGASSSAGGPRDPGSPDPNSSGRSPDFLASRSSGAGLAGSAADRIASGQPGAAPTPASPPSDELAGLVAPAAAVAATRPAPIPRPPSGAHPTTTASGRRPTVSSTRAKGPTQDHDGPAWETARRYEAYPTIKARASLPGIPRVLLWVGVLAIGAAALFFLPDVLDIFGGGGGGAAPTPSPTSSAAATAAPTDTPIPEPTPQTYTIKKGDILNKIAKKFGLTLDQLLAANKATIKDPNKIKVGQVIIIPVPAPSDFTDPSAAAPSGEAAPTDSPAP